MRKRANPSIEIAYCNSLSRLNCSTCESDIVPRTILLVASRVSGSRLIGRILPLTLIHGGAPTVTNRSDPRSSWSMPSHLSITLMLAPLPQSVKTLLVESLASRLRFGDETTAHKFRQALIQRNHARALARLDRRVHL